MKKKGRFSFYICFNLIFKKLNLLVNIFCYCLYIRLFIFFTIYSMDCNMYNVTLHSFLNDPLICDDRRDRIMKFVISKAFFRVA